MSQPFTKHLIDYKKERLAKLSGKEGYEPRVYGCTSGIPTIGIGYALITGYRDKKLNKMIWKPREDIIKDLKAVGAIDGGIKTLPQSDLNNLKEVIDKLDAGKSKKEISDFIKTQSYSFTLTEKQAKDLFDRVCDREYEATVTDRLANKEPPGKDKKPKNKRKNRGLSDEQIVQYKDTSERLALLSLAYRGTIVIRPSIVKALKAENRQEAWFAIKYDTVQAYSEKNRVKGIYNRSSSDAEDFGLYDDPNNPTDEEAQRLIEVYKNHTAEIIEYDSAGHKDPFLPYLEQAQQQLIAHGKDPGISLAAIPKGKTASKKQTKKRMAKIPTKIPPKSPTEKTRTPSVVPEEDQIQKILNKFETYFRQNIYRRWF